MSSTCWYTRIVSVGSVWPSRYIARRGGTPTSARIEANVRRSVCGVMWPIQRLFPLGQQLVRPLTRGREQPRPDIVRVLAGSVARRESGPAVRLALGPRGEEDLMQARDQRHGPLRGIGLDAGHEDPAGGEVDGGLLQMAEFRHSRAGQ
jgi:hypothetical protein